MIDHSLSEYCGNLPELKVGACPQGLDSLLLARVVLLGHSVAVVARDTSRLVALQRELAFYAPGTEQIIIPGWDCLPYDRVGPSDTISAQRMWGLSRLAGLKATSAPVIILLALEATLQSVPGRDVVVTGELSLRPGQIHDLTQLERHLSANGYQRVSTVAERGEFAVRGGVIDVYSPASGTPVRLDFFGDHLESIRSFDPETQRSLTQLKHVDLIAVSEIRLDEAAISRFRSGFINAFGAPGDDPFYAAVSSGQLRQGVQHLLPLFCNGVESVFDYLPTNCLIHLDAQVPQATQERQQTIEDLYQSRLESARATGTRPRMLPPDQLYLSPYIWHQNLKRFRCRQVIGSDIDVPGEMGPVLRLSGRLSRNFINERKIDSVNLFNAVSSYVEEKSKAGTRVLIASMTEGASERLGHMLSDHGGLKLRLAPDFEAALSYGPPNTRAKPPQRIVLGLDHGFETDGLIVLSETDILGDRLISGGKRRQAKNFLTEATALSRGDLVVHIEHGIGRFGGIRTLSVNDAPHDCLELDYAGEAKLYLPVENIDLLTRYGGDSEEVVLDRLGSASWQSRKARTKARLKEMAEGLIKLAAERALKSGVQIDPPAGLFDEFCAQFPYDETEDQLNAIADVLEDLMRGQPMDRLICGDVGFGKTEVALRAAFVVAMSGQQVAVICPTTLLARQHFKTFSERFRGWPIRLGHLSRLASAADRETTRQGLARGEVEVVIGTHAILSDKVKLQNLGLVIVDEEHHFGVKHKEALKALRADVHMLSLSATPIPRTLQMALSGIRDLSIIATPPVDRLAVRTVVMPFDAASIREALLREKYRGGQAYYVVPRISDLSFVTDFLRDQVPEIKFVVGHGQLSPGGLEEVMNAFYEGRYDVLVSTTIVESGLDVPSANTLIVHRADQFGLAQLYQIRGRVGRSKARAYAYLTHKTLVLTEAAQKRLNILQSLDNLGAGFQLASHDLDIRGSGNLLGNEQSGHIREVGVELYQQMLEDTVAELRHSPDHQADQRGWSPQINAGAAVLIPEHYIPDLNIRLALYRRVSEAESPEVREALAAEFIDRFGPLPEETAQLLKVVAIKGWCRAANIAKLDIGPKGAVVTFRQDRFDNPAGLIKLIQSEMGNWRLRPDQKLLVKGEWGTAADRLQAGEVIGRKLAGLVQAVSPDVG